MSNFVVKQNKLNVKCCYFHEQGEKGEPGVTIAADGSIISAPRGPQGPKGIKVQECKLLLLSQTLH